MSTDRAPKTGETETVRVKPDALNAAEDARLDDAMRQADDLLVRSLQTDERRRRRKVIVFTIGVLAMIGIVCIVLVNLVSSPTPPAETQQPATTESVAQQQAKAADIAQEGWTLWQQRKLAEAELKFMKAVKIDPTLVTAWNGLGWAQTNQGKTDAAKKSFAKVISLEPGHAAAENGLGWIAFGMGQYDQAEKHWLVSAKNPQASAAWSGLAQLYLIQSNWDKAAEYAQKLIDAGDTTAQPFLDAAKAKNLPDVLRKQITPVLAEKVKPDGDSAQKGWQLLNKGQPNQAILVFQEMLKSDPTDANALNGLGWAYLRIGKQDQAQTAFASAIKYDANAAGSINGLAIILKNQGKTDEAIKLWTDMLARFPGPNAATYGLASTYLEQKQFDKALPLYEQLAKAEPGNPEIQQSLEKARAGSTK